MKDYLKKPIIIGTIYTLLSFLLGFIIIYNFPSNKGTYEIILSSIFIFGIISLFIKKIRFIGQGILIGTLMTIILGLVLTTFFISINNIDNQNTSNIINNKSEIYNNEIIGWTIEAPNGWEIKSNKELSEMKEKSDNFIKENLDEDYNVNQINNLVSFTKDGINKFISSIEPLNIEYEGEYDEIISTTKDYSLEVYKENFGNVSSSEIQEIDINGTKFRYFTFTIYNESNDVVFYQDIYSSLINGYNFTVILMYNNDLNKQEMLKSFLKSKFN